ncbi:MAG TPA: hypothetical protein IAD29_06825 [Candidatus Scatocola faecigallinarum]|jgi:hypothetical protein|nr:hypothetical protein [Candidatus Scatocola faecigallinarum]
MTKKEMQLELWKAMHGMVIPMPFLKDIPEANMKSFWEIYDNPKKNRQLAENRFENAPLLEKVRKETALCILEYASRGLFEELGALAVVFYYGSSGYSCAAETEDLLAVLARRNYSYAVHCAFCLLALNFESIDDSCLPMLERVFYRHKAGLEARGKRWFKKRCGCN